MKFVHVADCHIGAWRDPKMKALTHEAWLTLVDRVLEEQPDFLLIAGDFFNTAIPGIDGLKVAVEGLQKIKEAKIPVYTIAGSHDYSPSGKTMLDVLEEAGLLYDVMRGTVEDGKLKLRWTQDPQTGVKLSGILGKRGQLDRSYYEDLDRTSLEAEEGDKIFMFHTSIAELKPKELEKMEAYPASFLPRGCRYYAGGHVHITEETSLPGYDNIVYPGPLFPANYAEVEKLRHGSYCVVTDWTMERKPLELKPVVAERIDAHHKKPEAVEEAIDEALGQDINDAIVLLRIEGELDGPPGSIDFRQLFHKAYKKGAYYVMKNTVKLTSNEYEEVHVAESTPEQLEEELLREHVGDDLETARTLMDALAQQPLDGEKKYEYEARVAKAAKAILDRS